MARIPRAFDLLFALCLATGAAAGAQDQVPTPAQEPATDRRAEAEGEDAEKYRVAQPTKDIFDWVRELRHRPAPPPPGPDDYKKWMVAVAPVLTYGPTSGFGIGLAGSVAVYKGWPGTTRISSLVTSVTGTTQEQFLVNARLNAHSVENRWHFEGDNRLHWTLPVYLVRTSQTGFLAGAGVRGTSRTLRWICSF